jgi:predicted RNA-binding Zn-ribbon protein involved in translation (DUF1610 family)
MDALMLDGNAAAGVLQEIFAVEMTTALGTCDSCGNVGEVGRVHLYRGAGIVLRCSNCGAVLMTIVRAGERSWIDLRGIRTLELRES